MPLATHLRAEDLSSEEKARILWDYIFGQTRDDRVLQEDAVHCMVSEGNMIAIGQELVGAFSEEDLMALYDRYSYNARSENGNSYLDYTAAYGQYPFWWLSGIADGIKGIGASETAREEDGRIRVSGDIISISTAGCRAQK